MPRKKQIKIDFSRVTKRKRRSQRDIFKYWSTRYAAFTRAGFSDQEAMWAADNGLSLRSSQVKGVIKHRKEVVTWYMKRFGHSRDEAIRHTAADLESKLESLDITELNLFYEVSP